MKHLIKSNGSNLMWEGDWEPKSNGGNLTCEGDWELFSQSWKMSYEKESWRLAIDKKGLYSL